MSDIKPVRLRKAWRIHVRSYDNSEIFYAATAGKARAQAWRRVDTADITFADITVRREPSADHRLPVRDPIADVLNDEETHCLLHAFGADCGDPIKAGYRDYFYTRRDDPPLMALTERGLMSPMAGDKWGENMTYFILTEAGKRVALSLVPEYPR